MLKSYERWTECLRLNDDERAAVGTMFVQTGGDSDNDPGLRNCRQPSWTNMIMDNT